MERIIFDFYLADVQFINGEKGRIAVVAIPDDNTKNTVFATMYLLPQSEPFKEICYLDNVSTHNAQRTIEQKINELYNGIQISNTTCGYFVIAKENGICKRFIMTYISPSNKWELKSLDNSSRKSSLCCVSQTNLRNIFTSLYSNIS